MAQTNKAKPLASIISVLFVVAREPIEWLTVLIDSSRNNTSHLILIARRLLFLQQQQLTFALCPKLTIDNH
jgi:hypothetical protein